MRPLLLLGLLALWWPLLAPAQTQEPACARPQPSRVGLVLGGGGARGLAHVGVLQVLEEQGVQIHAVAGTSMGAIIGGLYAAGYRASQIERIALGIDWERVFSDDAARQQRSMQRKQDDRLGLIGASAGLKNGKLVLPAGILTGQQISLLLQRLFLPRADIRDFDRLPIPFRAVATDIVSGEAVVMRRGNLAEAIRASMNVPGIFAPVEWEGHQLVDGGLVNNLPVTVMRQMGVDYIIAVPVSAPMLGKDKLGSLIDVTDQLTRMMIAQNESYQEDFLTDADVLIRPDLSEIGSGDFNKASLAIAEGRKAAEGFLQRFRQWCGRERPLPSPMVAQTQQIAAIQVENDLPLAEETVLQRLRQPLGQPLDVEQLEADIERIYGTGLYQKISWRLENEPSGHVLVLTLQGKAWGPAYLQTGLSLTNNFTGDSAYEINLRYLRTVLNPLGGEAAVYARLGQNPLLELDWFQPLSADPGWYVGARGGYRKTNVQVYQEGSLLSNYRLTHYGMEASLGYEWSTDWRLQATLLRERGRAGLEIGFPIVSDDQPLNNAHIRLGLLHDSLDSLYFPTSGWLLRARWMGGKRWMGSESDYQAVHLQARIATHLPRQLLWLGGEWFGSSSEDAGVPLLQRPTLGGFLRLSGMQENQLILGENQWLLNAALLQDIRPWLGLQALPVPVYLGASLEAGRSRNREHTPGQYRLIRSGSLFLGVDTWVGPVFLGYGRTDQGDEAVFFHLNRQFGER